jgi:hypothetical protein
VLGKGCIGGEHCIISAKLLKVAQLYAVYCTVVLMAVSILGNLLIKKVLRGIILYNNKYSGPCTLSLVFVSNIVEIGSVSVITYKGFKFYGETLKELLL